MEALSVTSRSSEHWLTTMMCTICEHTPDCSPLFRCPLGHMICKSCFESLAQSGTPECKKCNGKYFKQQHVSKDFLRKLKLKPGIGRPRRYQFDVFKSKSFLESMADSEMEDQDETVTIEKLFQLSTPQLKQLFESTAKEKSIRQNRKEKDSYVPYKCSFDVYSNKESEKNDSEGCSADSEPESSSISSKFLSVHKNIVSTSNLISKKPLMCPHGDCRKVVTISSFLHHFHHDHRDIRTLEVERGKALEVPHDVAMIEFNTSYCIVIIKVHEVYNIGPSRSSKIMTVADRLNQKVTVGTFWLMVSGSAEEIKSRSFVLYWLLTNTEERINCTIELSSRKGNFNVSTVCAVNELFDSRNITDIASRLNCLNLCYASMQNLLEEGPDIHLRVTVY